MILCCSDDTRSRKIFEKIIPLTKKKFSIIKNIKEFNFYKKKAKVIITGTAAGNSLDKKISLYAKKKKICRYTLFDSPTWIENRISRFQIERDKDYIIVEDNLTYNLCIKNKVKKKNILNLNQLFQSTNKSFSNIIYVSEPLRIAFKLYKKNYLKKDEYYYLRMLTKNLPKNLNLHIKLHPSEKKNKYKKYVSTNIRLLRKININRYKFSFGVLSKFNFYLSNSGLKNFMFMNSLNKNYIHYKKDIYFIKKKYDLTKKLNYISNLNKKIEKQNILHKTKLLNFLNLGF